MFGIVYTNVRTKYFIIMTKNMKNTETSIPIRKSPFINNRADIQTNRNTTIAEMLNASFIDC